MNMRLARRAGLAASIAAFLLSAPASLAQINPTRISGTLKLEDGTPLGKVKLHFTPGKGSAKVARDLKVNSKGKFVHNFFPAGRYKISLISDKYFLKHVKFTSKKPSGEPWEDVESDAHPETGLPVLSFHGNARNRLELVAADISTRKKMIQAVAVAEASAELERASMLFEQADMAGVLSETGKLLAENPDLGPACYLRGVALHRTGQLEEAERTLARAVELVPEQPGVCGVYAMALLDLAKQEKSSGKLDKAGEHFSRAADYFAKELETNPSSLAALTNRVIALEGANRDEDEIAAINALMAVDPSNIAIYFRLAGLYRKLGKTDKALDTLASVPAAGQDAAAAIYNVCVHLYDDKQYDMAITGLAKAQEVDPNFALTHHLLGYTYLAKGETEKALSCLEKYLEMAPESPEAAKDREIINALKK